MLLHQFKHCFLDVFKCYRAVEGGDEYGDRVRDCSVCS